MKKLFTLLTLMIVAITTSWAQDFIELRTVDFTALPATTFNDGKNTVATEGYTDIEFWKKSGKTLTLNATAGEGVAFGGQNIAKDHLVAIPLTGVNGSLKVTLYHSYSSAKASYKIAYTVGTTVNAGSSGTGYNSNQQQPKDANNADTNCSYTYTGLTSEEIVLYVGEASSNYPLLEKVVIETLAPSVVDPAFSLSKSSIGTDETAQINVGTKTGLDGITLSDIAYGTAGVVTVDADGVVTPVAAGSTTITFNSAAVDGKYNASEGNELSITVTAPVVTSPTITAGGYFVTDSKTVEIACEDADATIEYSTDNATWSDYTEALTITETTTVYAKAVKAGCVDSEVVSATYTKFEKSDLAPISAETTWTFPTSLTLEFTTETFPAKYDDYYTYADIAAVNNNELPATFDGTTLAFSGQYPYRGNNGSQNGNLQFITTVPGTVTVQFSNTGGSNKERWVKVNETIGTVEADGTTKRTEDFSVSAGTVTITHVNNEGELSPGLRFYTITFTPATTETITIPEAGVLTYVTQNPVDFSTIDGDIKAYAVTATSTSSATTAEVGAVAAGTPLLIKGTAGDYDVEIVASGETPSNLLQVSDGTVTGGDNIYAYSKTAKKFKKVSSSITIPAGKCYLEIEGIGGDALDIIFDGEATAIGNVNVNDNANYAPVKVITAKGVQIGKFNVAGQQVK